MGKTVLTGKHFWYGNIAIAEGAIAAGCRFFAGYPITPATEVAEHISRRFPEIGGRFIQFEDELASMAAVLGASWAGAKSMTATSGPTALRKAGDEEELLPWWATLSASASNG